MSMGWSVKIFLRFPIRLPWKGPASHLPLPMSHGLSTSCEFLVVFSLTLCCHWVITKASRREAAAEGSIVNVVRVYGVWGVAASEMHKKLEIRWCSRVFCWVTYRIAI